jgi:ABC-type transport system involved in multi-copper enzyme maturation permease subunit
MNTTRIKTHFSHWRAWEFNPIVIKELRQAVRSWAVTAMLLLLLLVLLVAAIAVLVSQSLGEDANEQLGGELFQTFLIILAGAGILFIPLYLGLRVAAEREVNNPDMLYISTLSPGRIIRGKFLSGAYVTLLFFSVCLPFMALTNLLRGVDLPTVFFLLVFLFLVVCAVNLAAIFIACLPISRLFKIVLSLAGFLFLFYLLGWVVMAAFEMMQSGVGAMLLHPELWDSLLFGLVISFAAAGLFYVLSVALISPPSANRALAPRLYLTVLCLAGEALVGWRALDGGRAELLFAWVYPITAVLIAALLVSVSNHDQLSLRVRRTIPRSRPKRMLAFCFYNGAAGGVIWAFVLTVLAFLETWGFFAWQSPGSGTRRLSNPADDFATFGGWYLPLMLYFFAYALFARWLHRRFLPKTAPKMAGIMTVFLTALTALGPNIVLFFLNQLSWKSADHLQLGNAFNLMGQHDSDQQMIHLWFALGLLLIAFVLNAKWFFNQWNYFRPPAEKVPPSLN